MGQFLILTRNGLKMSKYRLSADNLFERSEENNPKDVERIVFLSVEGNQTEQDYFKWLEKYRDKCGINSLIHVHVLHRSNEDGRSGVQDILELLEEYITLRTNSNLPEGLREKIPEKYSDEFIINYLNEKEIDSKLKEQFEKDLEIAKIDLAYTTFLREYKSENDIFGIVFDRDWHCHKHSQLKEIVSICHKKEYKIYLSNPCFEFWLLLHVTDVKNEYANCLNKFLQNPSVSKRHTFTSRELSKKSGHHKDISEEVFVEKYLPNIDIAIERASKDYETTITELIGLSENNDEKNHGKIGTNLFELIRLLKGKKDD